MASIAAVGTRIGVKISICAYQGHPLWLQATYSAREAINCDGHKDSAGHTSH